VRVSEVSNFDINERNIVMEIKNNFMPVYQREKAFEVQLQKDLKTLVQKTEELEGVSRVAVISAKDIIVDERVRWKCKYPVCFGIGSSPLCPPNTPPVDECERVIHSFRYGIVFQKDVPVKDFSRARDDIVEDPPDAGKHFVANNDICNQIEAWANSMGYRQAVSLGGGPCANLISGGECGKIQADCNCAVLQGGTCRNFLKVRPAMEAMAIDVIGTILPLGWDMVYIGGDTNKAEDIPCASTTGLLLVA